MEKLSSVSMENRICDQKLRPLFAASFHLHDQFRWPEEEIPDVLWPGAERLRSHRAGWPYRPEVVRTKRTAASERRVTCSFWKMWLR